MSAAEYAELADELLVPAATAVAFAVAVSVGIDPVKLADAVVNGLGC